MFYSSIDKTCKQTRCPLVGEWISYGTSRQWNISTNMKYSLKDFMKHPNTTSLHDTEVHLQMTWSQET